MARLSPSYTSLKTLEITYRPAKETLLSTPEILPTSEPTTPQISYTVQESDLPILNLNVYRKVWVAWIVVAGYCPSSATIYHRMLRNGSSVSTGSSSVSARYYYTRIFYFYNVNVGDVLEVKLWSSATDSDWRYKAYQIQVTRIIPLSKIRLLSPCNIVSVDTQPTLTLGNPSVYASYLYYVFHLDGLYGSYSSTVNFACLYVGDILGLYRINYGDITYANSSTILTSTTYYPRYIRNYVPTKIVFRGLIVG